MLFTIGTLGVLLRRNALVIFMSVELQLNAAVLLLTERRWTGASAGWLGCLTVLGSFATTVFLLLHFTGKKLPVVDQLYHWIASGTFRVDVAFRVDQLSLVMALTVSGVGLL